MAYFLLILAVGLAFLVAVFAVQNSAVVVVDFFMWRLESSLVLVILGAAALGFLSSLALQLYIQLKIRYQLYKANGRIRQLEEEISSLQRPEAVAAKTVESPAPNAEIRSGEID